MPSLTVKAFAELLDLSAYQQSRILYEQKHPKDSPQIYMQPFYSLSLAAIKNFYKNDNKIEVITKALSDCNSLKPDAKIKSNKRVLDSFLKSKQHKRKLSIQPSTKNKIDFGTVRIKLNFDIEGQETDNQKYLFYNLRNNTVTPNIARNTIELSYYTLKMINPTVSIKDIEYIDLYSDTIYKYPSLRNTTVNKFNQNIKIIEAIWTTL